MELALRLGGDSVPKPFPFLDTKMDLGFCMVPNQNRSDEDDDDDDDDDQDRPVQLDLLPFSPVHRTQLPIRPWLTDTKHGTTVRSAVPAAEEGEDGAALSSPNTSTTVSSFPTDFWGRNGNHKRDLDQLESERRCNGDSRALSDDEDNSLTRKKLRLSKDQSVFLEESFKEHSTLNPKQKLALAKQLNLRPRQVEVWFQNRRARTKLKQTEVDCEYLKKCCETLTEENRRLQKELHELRALKSSQPFSMQLPATTLTMCPSCERVATASAGTAPSTAAGTTVTKSFLPLSIANKQPRPLFPFSHAQPQLHQAQAQAH